MIWVSLITFFAAWIGCAVAVKREGGSRVTSIGGGFIVACLVTIVIFKMFGEMVAKDDLAHMPPSVPNKTDSPMPFIPVVDHNYVMQDGMKYGYPMAISEDARKSGQKAEQLVMAMYAGEKNGKYQAHIVDGVTVTALECEAPCKFLKVMSYIDDPYLKDQIKVEHLAANPEILGYLIMQDAMRGKLKQYGVGTEKKRFTVWVDERKGMQRTPFSDR